MPQQPRYLSTDPNAGLETTKYLSTDPNAGSAPAPPPAATSQASQLGEMVGEFGHAINPIEMAKGLYGMASNLVGTVQGMGATHERIFHEAKAAYDKGDYPTATRKFVNYLIPIIGPITDKSADQFAQGRWGAGTGTMLGFGAQMAIPGAVAEIPSMRVGAVSNSLNAMEQAAVQFGQREGIPIDAATATGNRFVRGTQKLADESLLGSGVGGRARKAQAEALTQTGDKLAQQTSPLPVTAEQAGQGVRDAVSSRASTLNADANTAYSRLRALEQQRAQVIARTGGVQAPSTSAQPFTNVPLAVDIAPTKAAMKPLYEQLKREAKLVPLMGDKAKALTALDRMMQAPDMAPLSIADSALSDLKAMARVDEAFKRSTGQGIAAQAVTSLDKAVVGAAKQGGPQVFKALMDGRAATINKFKTIDVFDALRGEPVQVFNQLTANKDSAVALLRKVQKEAPAEIPKIGRAYLEGLLTKATAEGGFGRTDAIFADWQRLGPQSKQLLFRDPALVKDLDQFFLLAKKMGENPNPSGSALTVFKGGELMTIASNPALGIPISISGATLAKLLHSPRGVRALTQGLKLPAGNRSAARIAAAEVAQAAREQGVSLVPVTAEDQSK